MEFSINNEWFIKAISDVSKAVSPNTNIPILAGIKLIAAKEAITLIGSNSEIAIEKKIPARIKGAKVFDIYQPGSVVIPSKYLYELIKKMPGDLLIKVNESHTVTIQSGEIISRLNGWNPADYPSLPNVEQAKSFHVPALQLIDLIKQTVFAVSKNQLKPVLSGVHIAVSEASLIFSATDSYRLAVKKIDIHSDVEGSLVVPGSNMAEAAKLITHESGETAIHFTEHYIVFIINSISLYSRLIEGVFPNIAGIMQIQPKTKVTLDKRKLLQCIDRTCLFAREWRNNNVNLEIQPDSKILISSNSSQIGAIQETLDVKIEGDTNFGISVDGSYLLDALKVINGENVSVKFGGTMRPVIIEPLHDPSHLQLISPVRSQ
ncbi:DNA polymerase-3 subunit beta [Peribacillus deserti]|uniref:Beta sliding clamp n=1 Tax=Peribacillus deserti TaxID=673318 RepID=A0ABS2QE44_9BACI|nr:DNA polymerase III subunit beta [Peribacillus deserti]MBM7691426.1 DNA polymerase-3 subunit beta [Peribacillus deserti]